MPKTKELSPKEMWQEEERKKAQQAKVDAAKERSAAYAGPATYEEHEAQSDWELLGTIGQGRFPDSLALKFDLTWEQRRACIARCVGWTIDKIALASKKDPSTITRWLNKETAQEFIAAFEYHNGTRDAKELIDKEVYKSLQVLVDLRDNPAVSASTRADISWKFIEQKYGKAKESKEVKSISIRELTEQLQRSASDEIIDPSVDEKLDNEKLN